MILIVSVVLAVIEEGLSSSAQSSLFTLKFGLASEKKKRVCKRGLLVVLWFFSMFGDSNRDSLSLFNKLIEEATNFSKKSFE